jgi:uncharacterized membrane protein
MPYCAKCGSAVEGPFCGSCGQRVDAPAAGATLTAVSGLTDNVAGLLCYLFGFITGIIFLALEPYNKSKFIRFHAFQSIFLSVAWFAVVIVESVLNSLLLNISLGLFGLIGLIWTLFWLAFLCLVVFLMVKAYQGQRFKLPIIGDLAEKQA